MPRGNDKEAASQELASSLAADSFAQGLGNAEELIDANNRAHSIDVIKATMKATDEEATAEARENLDAYSGPNGEDAEDVAVKHGGAVLVVYEDDTGRLQKNVVSDDDDTANGPGAKPKAKPKAAAKDSDK